MIRVGLIGCGAMAQAVVASCRSAPIREAVSIVGALGRPSGAARHDAAAGFVPVLDDIDVLLALGPEIVVEVASHEAVQAFGPRVLRAGKDLMIASAGALASGALHAEMKAAATHGHARCFIPAGAVGGTDVLATYRLTSNPRVVYRSIKPVAAWRGSEAERSVDLDAVRTRTVFFSGTARRAAALYPKNANVAATIALACAGFDRTQVELIVDPASQRNSHEIEVEGGAGRCKLFFENAPLPDNPRTSALTALSVVQGLLSRQGCLLL